MEASETMVCGNVDSPVKLISAFETAGIDLIDAGAVSHWPGRDAQLKIADSDKTRPGTRSDNGASSRPRVRT